MPRLLRKRPVPSGRNLLMYHELAYNSRTQAAVAAHFRISQRRVCEIGGKVRSWVDCVVPRRHFRSEPGLRLHLAIAMERQRLQDAYDPLIGLFTGDDDEPRFVRRYVAVVAGRPLNTVEVSDKPDIGLLNQAADVQAVLSYLEFVANLGPFADVPCQVTQQIVHTCGTSGDESPVRPVAPSYAADSSSSKAPHKAFKKNNRGVLNVSHSARQPPSATYCPPRDCGASEPGVFPSNCDSEKLPVHHADAVASTIQPSY